MNASDKPKNNGYMQQRYEAMESRIALSSYASQTKTYTRDEGTSLLFDVYNLHNAGLGHHAIRALINFAVQDTIGARKGLPEGFSNALRNIGLEDKQFLKTIERIEEAISEGHGDLDVGLNSNRSRALLAVASGIAKRAFRLAQYPETTLTGSTLKKTAKFTGLGSFFNRVSDKARNIVMQDLVVDLDQKFEHGFWNNIDFEEALIAS